jgi:hypothetical protein
MPPPRKYASDFRPRQRPGPRARFRQVLIFLRFTGCRLGDLKESVFDALRGRDDFQKLLAELVPFGGHTDLILWSHVRRVGFIDLRAQTQISSVLRTDTPTRAWQRR